MAAKTEQEGEAGLAGESGTGRVSSDCRRTRSDRAPAPPVQLLLPDRRLLLAAGDLLALDLALAGAMVFRWRGIELDPRAPVWLVSLGIAWLLIAPAFGCYDLRTAGGRRRGVEAALRAGGTTVGVYFVLPYVSAPLLYSRAAMLLFAALALFLLGLWRAGCTSLISQPQFRVRALVLGAGWAGRTLATAVRDHAPSQYELVGFVDDDPSKQGATLEGVQVIADGDHLLEAIERHQIQELILAITRNLRSGLHRALIDAFESGVRVVPMHEVYETVTSRIAVEHVGDQWVVALPAREGGGLVYGLLKRGVDVLLGLAGTLLLAILFPVLALAVRLDTSGPVLYSQERVGHRGRSLRLVKFRSMVCDAEADGNAVWAAERDPRVTRVGRVLRSTRLDELPQFLSILKGEMSLIGPRPERPEFVEKLQAQIPFYRARLLVKPGLTGWAQVMYRYGGSAEDALTKLQYDLYYIKHQSLYLDLSIILRTIGVVLRRAGT